MTKAEVRRRVRDVRAQLRNVEAFLDPVGIAEHPEHTRPEMADIFAGQLQGSADWLASGFRELEGVPDRT